MTTRAELDERARSLGINSDEYSRKAELAAAIEDVEKATADADATDDAAPTGVHIVLSPLTHRGEIIEPGSPVPDDLGAEAIAILIRQGHVSG